MNDSTKTKFSVEGFSEDTIPGVTALLNPKLAMEKQKSKDKQNAQSAPPSAPQKPASAEVHIDFDDTPPSELTKTTSKPTPQTSTATELGKMGVFFELQFENQHNLFRYTKMKPHTKASLELWQQKFYFQMKIDLKALGIQLSFQEFSKKQSPFHEDAFGMVEANYVQVVRLENNQKTIFVLLSSQSLLQNQDEVRAYLEGKKAPNDEDSIKIELAA